MMMVLQCLCLFDMKYKSSKVLQLIEQPRLDDEVEQMKS